MKVIYARISTANQNAERQMSKEGKLYLDVCSGKVPFFERPEASKLLKNKEVTELEVLDIDRLGRNLSDILNTIQELTNRGINIHIVNQGLNTITNGKPNHIATMIINIMGSIAQFEREQTRQRCAEGIAIAKAKNVYKGRKRGATRSDEKTLQLHMEKIAVIERELSKGMKLNTIAKTYGYHRGLIYRLIEKGMIKKPTE
jgi:DNA invertase Pin-like site-specific DNA recombinase